MSKTMLENLTQVSRVIKAADKLEKGMARLQLLQLALRDLNRIYTHERDAEITQIFRGK